MLGSGREESACLGAVHGGGSSSYLARLPNWAFGSTLAAAMVSSRISDSRARKIHQNVLANYTVLSERCPVQKLRTWYKD